MGDHPTPGRPLRVLHLVGSPTSAEMDDLSRLYAADCLAAVADPQRYEPTIAHVAPDGAWSFPDDLSKEALERAPRTDLGGAVRRIAEIGPDLALPQMFCHAGMTTYRSLLDLVGLPYVGSRPETMAHGAHKAHARALVEAAGVRVPRGVVLRSGDEGAADLGLALPLVVKPAGADNSAGVTLVREADGLAAAVAAAREHGEEVLVEEFVPLGREVRCGVLETEDGLVGLPLEEYAVHPERKPIRDAADKLARDPRGELRLVAKDAEHAWIVADDDPVVEAVHAAATTCFEAMGCRHYGLFDFRIDPEGRPYFLEAGLYCSYAHQSVVVVMARAAGIGVGDLFARGVAQALGGAAGLGADPPGTPR